MSRKKNEEEVEGTVRRIEDSEPLSLEIFDLKKETKLTVWNTPMNTPTRKG